jgi:hypothetical protein
MLDRDVGRERAVDEVYAVEQHRARGSASGSSLVSREHRIPAAGDPWERGHGAGSEA